MTASLALTRIVLADPFPICMTGAQIELSRLEGACVVARAFSPTQLLDVLGEHECDVLVSEYYMSDAGLGDGLGMFGRIRQQYPGLKLVVLTSICNPIVLSALEYLGVRAVVSKRDLPEHMREALLAVLRSEAYLSPEIQAARSARSVKAQADITESLTRAEVEVVRLFLSGQSLGEIAGALRLSKQTVGAKKRAAMRKLDVRNDAGLVRYGLKTGLAI